MRVIGSCPVCGRDQLGLLLERRVSYPGDDLLANLLDIDYVRNHILFDSVLHRRGEAEFAFQVCKHCGFIFFNPRPEDQDMAIKYGIMDELRDTELRDAQRGPPLYDGERAQAIYASLSRIRKLDGLRVVDVGGANGYNLKCFTGSNECFVVDYGKRELMDGVSYLGKTISEVPDSMRFDVILCCHTLEHMVNPVGEISAMRRVMAPGALLYIEVPLGCHEEYKQARDFLTHINFFSEGSVRQLLSMCSMKLEYITTKLTTVRWFRWLTIVAIARNLPPNAVETEGYRTTIQQMNERRYHLLRSVGHYLSWFERSLHHLRARGK